MTFKPPDGKTSIEKIEDSQVQGFVFSDRTKQGVQGGSVRLLPQLTGNFQAIGAKWPVVASWDQQEEFPADIPNSVETRWDANHDPEFAVFSGYLKLNPTGQALFLEQSGTGVNGTKFSDVSPIIGYTLQFRAQVLNHATGDAVQGAMLLFDDGSKHDVLRLRSDGVYLESNEALGVVTDMKSSPKDVRLTVRGDDFWLWVEGNDGVYAENGLTQDSATGATKKLLLGSTGDVTADLRMDYLYQKHEAITDVPDSLDTGFGFSTDLQSTRLPAFYPKRYVDRFNKVLVDTSHGESEIQFESPYLFSEDFDSKTDNIDLLVIEPTIWSDVAGPSTGSGGLNVDFDGSDGVLWSSNQYVRFIGHVGELREDHYFQITYGRVRTGDGSFIDNGTDRFANNILMKDDGSSRYYYRIDWQDLTSFAGISLFIYKIDRTTSTASLKASQSWTSGADITTYRPDDGKKIRVEIRGRVISVYLDVLDGNGLVKQLEWEDTETSTLPPSDGDPGLWLGPRLTGGGQSTIRDLEVGNFEGGGSSTVTGTTRLKIEKSTDGGQTWGLAKSVSITSIPRQEVSLSDIAIDGLAKDALRFTVEQSSPGGLAEAIRVDQLTVKTDFKEPSLDVFPCWGPKVGGTNVALTIKEGAKALCATPPTESDHTKMYTEDSTDTGVASIYGSSMAAPPYGNVYGSPTVIGAPSLGLSTVEVPIADEAGYSSKSAQEVWGNSGDGVTYTLSPPGSGNQLLRGYLEVLKGAAYLQANTGQQHVFRNDTYQDTRRVGLVFSGGSLELIAAAFEADSHFRLHLENMAELTLTGTSTGAADAHRSLETWTIVDGLNTEGDTLLLSTKSTGEGLQLGLNADGRPFIRVSDGTTEEALTGEFPLTMGDLHHVAGGIVQYPDRDALEILLNGEICGQKESQVQFAAYGDGEQVQVAQGADPGSADSAGAVRLAEGRTRAQAPDSERRVVELGIADPFFGLDTNWPLRDSTRLLAHMDAQQGSIVDKSLYGHYPVVLESKRRNTVRGADGYFGRSLYVVGAQGGAQIAQKGELEPNTGITISFFTKAYANPSADSSVWAHGTGLDVAIDTEGQLKVTVPGGEHIHTGQLLGVNKWRPAWVQLDVTGNLVRTRVGTGAWEESSMSLGIPDLSDLPVELGFGLWGLLDEVAFHRELLDTGLYDSLTSLTGVKSDPNENVIWGGSSLAAANVRHTYVNRKHILTPTGAVGGVSVGVEVYGKTWPAECAFKYTDIYSREIDASKYESQACKTKGPFRIGNRVPDGGVNLALLGAPPMSVPNNVSLTDMSDREAANIAFYNQGRFIQTDPTITGQNSGEFYYSPQFDTKEVYISNRSVMRRQFKQPVPLFFKYLVGRGRFYVYQPDATDATDADLIRKSIQVQDRQGRTIPLEVFPWDITVSRLDYYGSTLPTNTFSVVLYTERIPLGETRFVVYNGADAQDSFKTVPGKREVINPVPIFELDESGDLTRFEFDMNLDTGGFYDLRIVR